MTTQYLIKYLTASGKYTNHDETNDVFGLKGIRLGGVLFDETNIVTVSGVNSQTATLAALQATLQANINAVSGGSSIRDDGQDTTITALTATVISNFATLHTVSGTLQSEITAILNDKAKEERFEAVSGQTLFTLSTIVFDPGSAVHDIVAFKNGLKVYQSLTGSLSGVSGGDFIKVGTTQVQWLYGLRDGDRVVVREERTGSGAGGGGGGSTDLTDITTDLIPDLNGARSVGAFNKGFAAVYLKDTMTTDIWQLEMVSGVITAVAVGS